MDTKPSEQRKIGVLLLAAGSSSRTEGVNKLLALHDGVALVTRAARAIGESRVGIRLIVTGHQAEEISAAVRSGTEGFLEAHNPAFASGMASSLQCGLAALPEGVEAVIVCLADMPQVTAALIDRLIEAYDTARRPVFVVPTARGVRGNPVVISRHFFPEIARLEGDVGARRIIADHPQDVVEVEVGEAALFDLDTRIALAEAGYALD